MHTIYLYAYRCIIISSSVSPRLWAQLLSFVWASELCQMRLKSRIYTSREHILAEQINLSVSARKMVVLVLTLRSVMHFVVAETTSSKKKQVKKKRNIINDLLLARQTYTEMVARANSYALKWTDYRLRHHM